MTGQADLRVGGAVFEGLVRYDAAMADPEPGLAERWEVSSDGRTYTFHLRPGVSWSTGEAIVAEDFAWSWRRLLEPTNGCEYAAILFYVRNGEAWNTGRLQDPAQLGFRALDATRFEVELVRPTPFFLDLCALPTLAVVPRRAIESGGDRWLLTPPVPASGAYQIESWRINDRIRLRRNPRYWDAARTRMEVVDLLPCNNANTALNLFTTRAADIVWDKNLVPADLLDVLVGRADFHTFPVLSSYFLRFNVTRKPFDDVRVRQAFARALDRDRIVRKVTRGGEVPATALTPPIIAGYTPPEGLPLDPVEARRLLAEAGYPEGRGFPEVQYLFDTTTRLQEQIAVELRAMWQDTLGVRVGLRKLEWKTYLAAQRALDYDLCRSSWIGDYSDPNTFLDLFLSGNGNNRTGWKSARFDALLDQANGEPDRRRRFEWLREAETLLVRDEAPIAPVFVYTGMESYDPARIGGISGNPRAEHPVRAIFRRP